MRNVEFVAKAAGCSGYETYVKRVNVEEITGRAVIELLPEDIQKIREDLLGRGFDDVKAVKVL